VLSLRPLVWVGLISYPLYLWHWPLLVLGRIVNAGELSAAQRLEIVAASVALAIVTYWLVEKPVRFGARGATAPVALMALIAGLAGLGVYVAHSGVSRIADTGQSSYVRSFENSAPEYRYSVAHHVFADFRDECNFYDAIRKQARTEIAAGCVTPATGKVLLLWGDSHAAQFSAGLRAELPRDVSILQVTSSACSPSLEPVSPDPFNVCNRSNRVALETVRHTHPNVVVLAQRADHELTDWQRIATALKSAGAGHVLLVGPVPQWQTDLYKLIARKYWIRTPMQIPGLTGRALDTDAILRREYSASSRVRFVSPIGALCNSEGCLAYLDGDRLNGIVTNDYGHLTRAGSEFLVRTILAPVLQPLLVNAK
jgi:hypothetical protein